MAPWSSPPRSTRIPPPAPLRRDVLMRRVGRQHSTSRPAPKTPAVPLSRLAPPRCVRSVHSRSHGSTHVSRSNPRTVSVWPLHSSVRGRRRRCLRAAETPVSPPLPHPPGLSHDIKHIIPHVPQLLVASLPDTLRPRPRQKIRTRELASASRASRREVRLKGAWLFLNPCYVE